MLYVMLNDVSLGWIPDPKGDYTRFSNSLLAEFYQCFWATCPFKENFRLEFIKERKRQWSIKEMIERAKNKVSYITSINTAAAGKFLHQNFQAKEHDSITISYNIDALVKAKGKLESSLRASSPIWASEASIARTRERGAEERRACNHLS